MRQYSVFTNEYDADIKRLIKKRLSELKTEAADELIGRFDASQAAKDKGSDRVSVRVFTQAEREAFFDALGGVLLKDLRCLELAEMVERLEISLEDKKSILKKAIRYSDAVLEGFSAREAIGDYFEDNGEMNLEGFMRFRLKGAVQAWKTAVDAAVQEKLEQEEFGELMRLMELISVFSFESCGAVTIIFNPDGSCTVSNSFLNGGADEDRPFRIECAPGSDEGILGMLSGMSPDSISIFDMSRGKCDELKARIRELFLNGGGDK